MATLPMALFVTVPSVYHDGADKYIVSNNMQKMAVFRIEIVKHLL